MKKSSSLIFVRSKGILREDETDIRRNCEEHQLSPIKMRTRNDSTESVCATSKEEVFDCQDCGKSFISEAPLVRHMAKEPGQ